MNHSALSQLARDNEGYLLNGQDWSEGIAELIAEEENINLEDSHWQVIRLIRTFFFRYDLSPAMRPLVKFIGAELGKDKGNSIYLMRLFPGANSPAKTIAKIAGLPRPANCL